MKQMQQVRGYGHDEPAHSVPISSLRELEDRQPKHQSLIQKCMKALIKEKMSGNLINADRKRRDREGDAPNYSQKKISDTNSSAVYGYLNSSIKRSRYQQDPENIIPISTTKHLQGKHSRHQSTLASINERLSKISVTQHHKNRLSLNQIQDTEQTQKVKQGPQNRLAQLKKNIQLSFISAIDNGDDETTNGYKSRQSLQYRSSLVTNIDEKDQGHQETIKLPKIRRHSKIAVSLLASPTSIIKNVLKKSVDFIDQDFWRFLTNQPEAKSKMRKISMSISDLNLTSSVPASKQVKSSIFKPSIPSSSRENFQRYLSNLPAPFVRLLEFVLSFFDVKLPTDLPALHYSGLLEEITSVNERAWSIIAFVFWDYNKDGIIKSNDLFEIFRQLNNFDEKKDLEKIESAEPKARKQIQPDTKIRKEIRHQRNSNKELMSSTDDIVNALKEFKPKEQMSRNLSMENKQSPETQDVSMRLSPKQIVSNLQNVRKAVVLFKEELQKLNKMLLSKPFEQVDLNQWKEPQAHPISYLEQIALTLPNLKYKQILPLFSAGGGKNSGNEHKLQIFPKDLNVKVSSSYRQCFISTEHNQETRMIRQRIDQFKQQLKKKREARNQMLQEKVDSNVKITKQLNYVRVAESQMGSVIKQIVLNLLGYSF